MKFYNTLTRKKEEFTTEDGSNKVRMYSCGPTVYSFAHIGNMRTYVFMDLLRRALKYEGYKVKGVIHAFSGSYEMAIKFIKLGFKLGIGGVITFKNCKLKEVIEKIDISNILLETDSPYLTPEPNRGKINSPLNLKYIAKFLSDLYNIPYDDVIKITSKNAKKVFNIR